MIIKILLIEKNQCNLVEIQKFIHDLGIDDYYVANSFLEALQTIERVHSLDLIICNASVLNNSEYTQLNKKVKIKSIPLLWITQRKEASKTKLSLNYSELLTMGEDIVNHWHQPIKY